MSRDLVAYISGRRMGKTEAIVSWLLADPDRRTIIVSDRRRQEHLLSVIGRKVRYARGKGYWQERVVIFDMRYNRMLGKYPGTVAIDDLEDILQLIFADVRMPVQFITMTATCIQDYTDPDTSEGEYIDSDAWEDSDERGSIEHVRRLERLAVFETERPRELPGGLSD